MSDISGLIGDIIGWAILIGFLASILMSFRFIYILLSPQKRWNADADKHITSAGGSGGTAGGGFTTTHSIPKDPQAQAKMYVPKENDK